MIKASGNWVMVEVENKAQGFMVADSTLLEGTVTSNSEHFKKGETVLFPSQHGKVMQHSIKGKKYYFVDKDIILAHE